MNVKFRDLIAACSYRRRWFRMRRQSQRKKRGNRAANVNLPKGSMGAMNCVEIRRATVMRREMNFFRAEKYERINRRNWPFKDFETGRETNEIASANWETYRAAISAQWMSSFTSIPIWSSLVFAWGTELNTPVVNYKTEGSNWR